MWDLLIAEVLVEVEKVAAAAVVRKANWNHVRTFASGARLAGTCDRVKHGRVGQAVGA